MRRTEQTEQRYRPAPLIGTQELSLGWTWPTWEKSFRRGKRSRQAGAHAEGLARSEPSAGGLNLRVGWTDLRTCGISFRRLNPYVGAAVMVPVTGFLFPRAVHPRT